MHIDLSEGTQQVLGTEATNRGRTLPESAAGLLSRYAEAAVRPIAETSHSPIKTHQDAVAWVLSRNPNPELNHPEDIDWQQLKSDGRRF